MYRRVDLVIDLSTYLQDRSDSSDSEDDEEEEEEEEGRRRMCEGGRKRARSHNSYINDSSEGEAAAEEEEREEVVNYDGNDDTTFTIRHAADGTTVMDRPVGYTRITQVVENGRNLTENKQMEELVNNLLPLLPLDQLERVAERVHQEIEQRAQQAVADQVGTNTNFFSTTSFSSGSEGEEEM